MASWLTPATARDLRELWPDVEQLEDSTLELLLDAARDQVIAYAPALPSDVVEREEGTGYGYGPFGGELPPTIPGRYAFGQFQQAKNIWNASRVDASGGIGDGSDFVMRPTPLDWHVKQILRPKRGRPRVR